MLGKTNATISSGGSGGGGATVTAVNKTGAAITSGEKVWLNDGGQVQGSSYQMYGWSGTTTYYQSYANVIDPTGQYGSRSSNVYSLTGTEATQISTSFEGVGGSHSFYFYDGENEVMLISSAPFSVTNYGWFNIYNYNVWGYDSLFIIIPGYKSNYCMTDKQTIKTFDYTTGVLSDTYTLTTSFSGYKSYYFIYLDLYKTIYYLNGSNSHYFEITNEGLVENNIVLSAKGICPIGCTHDSQFVVCKSTLASTYGQLRLLKVNSQFDIVTLTQTEMPADLQDYYEADSCITFNAKTQVLTCTKNNSSDYVVMQYSNGEWEKLNIDLSAELTNYPYWRGCLFLSDDLSRAVLNVGTAANTGYYGRVVNLTTQSGYIAQNYSPNIITENSITGYAAEDAAADTSFEANVAGE